MKIPTKRTIIFVGLLFFLVLLGCLVILTFPGATIFYHKIPIQANAIDKHGNPYFYSFQINHRLFNVESLLVLEDGKVLVRSYSDDPRYEQEGTFNLREAGEPQITVSFIPSENKQPENNEHSYEILIRLKLLSGNNVGRITVTLLAGIVIFLVIFFTNPRYRNNSLYMPSWLSKFWKKPDARPLRIIDESKPSRKNLFIKSIINMILLTFLFVFMEWLFFITKPSFMDLDGFPEKLKILLIAFFISCVVTIAFLLIFFLVEILLTPLFPFADGYFPHLPFAFLATCLILILVDNFSYTIFNLGIAGSSPTARILFAIGFITIFSYILSKLLSGDNLHPNPKGSRFFSGIALALFMGSLIVLLTQFDWKVSSEDTSIIKPELQKRPNIILISSDSLDASNLSLYGYSRDTTPFLQELGKTSLVGANNFPNTGHSLGSETSVLTGRYPLVTRVLYSPDILKGSDKFLHLPGILRDGGYQTISLGVPYYSDANVVNFQDAFDEVNCKEREDIFLSSPLLTNHYDQEVYLLSQIKKRVLERLKHIFFVDDMKSPITSVNEASRNPISDQERLSCLRSYLDKVSQTGKPLFAQIHQMGTHGQMFETTIQRFSKGQEQDRYWITDFYDDAIINFDSEIANLVKYLKSLGLYENTIIVIYTDHGSDWSTTKRLPLIIHFPKGEHSGIVKENTQNLDIAPTILDYLGAEIPEWMDGSSLLGDLDPTRMIISVGPVDPVKISGLWTTPANISNLPFQQFGNLTAIQCQKITTIDLPTLSVNEDEINMHTSPCLPESLDSRQVILDKVGDLLIQTGFQRPKEWK